MLICTSVHLLRHSSDCHMMKASILLASIFAEICANFMVNASPAPIGNELTDNGRGKNLRTNWFVQKDNWRAKSYVGDFWPGTIVPSWVPAGILPAGTFCIPQWTMDYFLCQGGWCEPTLCLKVLGWFWVTSYDHTGFCTQRPPDGQACVDKVPNIMD